MSAISSPAALTRQLSALPGISTASQLKDQQAIYPTDQVLSPLFARGGLPRGEILVLNGPQAFSLALASCAAMTREQLWIASLGVGEPAVTGLEDFGIRLPYFVNIRTPPQDWLRVTSILLDSFAALIIRPGFSLSPGQRQRLTAKVRERRMSLLCLSEAPIRAQRLHIEEAHWSGPNEGRGRLERCLIKVRSRATGVHTLFLPAVSGRAEPVMSCA